MVQDEVNTMPTVKDTHSKKRRLRGKDQHSDASNFSCCKENLKETKQLLKSLASLKDLSIRARNQNLSQALR